MGTAHAHGARQPVKPHSNRPPSAGDRDALTGLLNASGFYRCVRRLLDENPGRTFILVYGDLDRFKVFNDLYGAEAGDGLLAAVGSMLVDVLPQDSAAARLRADHFIACVPEEAFDADRFLDGLNRWFSAYPVDFTFFVRLGIYVIDDPSLDTARMSDRALIALREAKKSVGASTCVYYNDRLRDMLIKEQEMAGEMASALERGEFVAYFQPQFSYATGAIAGAEVLARWEHPTKGLVNPAEFIPVFERTGLIAQLDYYLWEEACKVLRQWLDDEDMESVPGLSVNISRVDIYRDDLCSYLGSLVEKYRIPADLLHLEITESAYMEAPRQLIGVVDALRSAGFAVAMDDFGSGYSSLNTLNDVPVDILKLDLGFLDASNETRGGIILASIVRMARWLDLPVIAEGVETCQQAEYLASIGCDVMQGYLFARPVDRRSFESMLRTQSIGKEKPGAFCGDGADVDDIWDAGSHFALLFNRFVGPAVLAEYALADRTIEVIRGNADFTRWFEKRIGRGEKGVAGFFDLLSPADGEAVRAMFDRLACEGGSGEYEARLDGSDGEALWVGVRMKPLARASDVQSFFVQFEETTEQQVLRDRLRATIDSVPGGILFMEVDAESAHLLDFSDAAAELSDCTREQYIELAKNDLRDLVVKQDRKLIQACVESLFGGSERFSTTVRIISRSGGFRWVHVSSSVMYRSGNSLCIVAVLTDVTKEQEAQRRFKQQATTQMRLYDAMPCGILRYTAEDELKLVSINRTGCDIFACADSKEFFEMVGDDLFAPLSPESREEQLAALDSLKQGASIVPFTCQATRCDGVAIWIEGNSSFTEGENGERIVQAAFSDVSHRRMEQHERDMQRYASVLCSVYDEIIEYDCEKGLCRVVYSAHKPSTDSDPLSIEESLRRWCSHIPDETERSQLRAAVEACSGIDEDDPVTCSYRLHTDEGAIWCQTTFLRMSDGYVLWCNKDVSERISAEDRRTDERIADIVSKLPVGVGVYRCTGTSVFPLYLSDRMHAMFGRTGDDFGEMVLSDQPASLQQAVRSVPSFGIEALLEDGIDIEFETEQADGSAATIHLQGRALREGAAGTEQGDAVLYAVATDVTEEVRERRSASWLNERYRILSELTHAISFDYDFESDTVLLYIDRNGDGMEAQVISRYFETLTETRPGVVHPDSIETVRTMFERVREGADSGAIEYRADYYGKGYAWYRTNLFVVSDGYGSRHLVGLIEDIQNEFDLRKRAELDETTGLSNHATAKDLVNLALSDPLLRVNSVCAVLDIDDFKTVNDTCGHIEGDALLHEVGSVLRSSFRETDVIGRVGGDEFVLLLKNIDLDVALCKIRAVVQRVSEYQVPGLGSRPSLSVGVHVIGEDDLTYRDAFVKADDALYRAKRTGKNKVVVYQAGCMPE